MTDAFQLIWFDIMALFGSLSIVDASKIGYTLLWLIILMTPLTGVDRRDAIACLVYTVFISAAAVTLFFALPSIVGVDESTFRDQFLTVMIVSAIACLRWSWKLQDTKGVLDDIRKKEAALDHQKNTGVKLNQGAADG